MAANPGSESSIRERRLAQVATLSSHLERWLLPKFGARPPVRVEVPAAGASSMVFLVEAAGLPRLVVRLLPGARQLALHVRSQRLLRRLANVPAVVECDASKTTLRHLGSAVLVESFLEGTPLPDVADPAAAIEDLGRTYARIHSFRPKLTARAATKYRVCLGPDLRAMARQAVATWTRELPGPDAETVARWLDRLPEDAFRFEPRLTLLHYSMTDVLWDAARREVGMIDLNTVTMGSAGMDLAEVRYGLNARLAGNWTLFFSAYRLAAEDDLLEEVARTSPDSVLLFRLLKGCRANYLHQPKSVELRKRLVSGIAHAGERRAAE